ncbi:hypothetical protein K1719_009233, partial [Acacia pycnantha]
MPLLEFANAHPSFQYSLCSFGSQNSSLYRLASVSVSFGNEQRVPCGWKSFHKLRKLSFNVGSVELRKGRLLIKAVATLEPKGLAANENKCLGPKDPDLGGIPWNKGRKHSPETLQKIKERTRLAMQNPK